MVDKDNPKLAQINKARAEISSQSLLALEAVKEQRFGDSKKLIDGMKSLVPR